jgi:hypothetical protein
LTTAGAQRLVIAAGSDEREHLFKRTMLKNFPGTSWVLFRSCSPGIRVRPGKDQADLVGNHQLVPAPHGGTLPVQRGTPSAGTQGEEPLLIYRNDGASSRVSKSVALKTYSSGPRGGLEGTRAIAEAYGLDHVLMIDVGGTTTDVGMVTNSTISVDRRGSIQGVDISFEMSNVHSTGVGGSSIIAVHDGEITVGPESVGLHPGRPASGPAARRPPSPTLTCCWAY